MQKPRSFSAIVLALLMVGWGQTVSANGATNGETRLHRFVVPAGDAERTLELFARQAGCPAVFPTDMIKGVRTAAIKGNFTDQEALQRMLTGTVLSPVYDEASQAFGVKRNLFSYQTIVLPPFLVEESLPSPWKYAKVPGMEVLSRCPDDLTRWLIVRQQQLHDAFSLIVPKKLQVNLEVPECYLLYNQDDEAAMRQAMATILRRLRGTQTDAAVRTDAPLRIGILPNFRLWEQDTSVTVAVLNRTVQDLNRLTLTPDYVNYLLTARVPALPAWFIAGIMELYPTIELLGVPAHQTIPREGNRTQKSYGYLTPGGVVPPQQHELSDGLRFKAFIWVSKAETRRLKKHPNKAPKLRLSTLFSGKPPEQMEESHRRQWAAEAALFVRWALDPRKSRLLDKSEPAEFCNAEALWNFVDQASRGPVTPEMFKACFHQSYQETEKQLVAYRTMIIGSLYDTFQLHSSNPVAASQYEARLSDLREATADEVGRIKGRADRLDIAYIKFRYPELTDDYITQAKHTLYRAYDKGDRDPWLLAELGLCECDAGSDAAAVPFLMAAAKGKVVHPRVYYELARIEFDRLRQVQLPPGLVAKQVERLIDLLEAGRKQSPALASIYELMVKIWLYGSIPADSGQAEVLDEAMRLFPRNFPMVYGVAILKAQQGNVEAARAVIEHGLTVFSAATQRSRLQKLQAALVKASGGPGK